MSAGKERITENWTLHLSEMLGATPYLSPDITADRRRMKRLIAWCKAARIVGTPDEMASNGVVSPWLAQQFGIWTQSQAAFSGPAAERRAAELAVALGNACGADQQRWANALTAAMTRLKYGQADQAAALYESILASSGSRGTTERIAAYAGLANLAYMAKDYGSAAYYFDKCLPHLKLITDDAGKSGTVHNAEYAYRQFREFGGSLFCLRMIDVISAGKLEAVLKAEPGPIDRALLVTTRLALLGDTTAADQFRSAWLSSN